MFLYTPYIYNRFERNNGWLLTSALAYFIVLSFIPISLIILTSISYILPSEKALPFYIEKIRFFVPKNVNIEEIFKSIIVVLEDKRYLGFIAIPVLFWLASLIFDVIEEVLALAFKVEKKRPFWKAKLIHFIALFIIGIVMAIFAIISTIFALISNSGIIDTIYNKISHIKILGLDIKLFALISKLINIALSFLTTIIVFYSMFKFLPTKNISNNSLIKGAIFSAIAFEIAKYIFSFYIGNINNFRWLFGQIATFAIILVWSFYASLVFVVGAFVSALFEKKKKHHIKPM
jgi:membrane protein